MDFGYFDLEPFSIEESDDNQGNEFGEFGEFRQDERPSMIIRNIF
jgi:hypothetical protein